MTVMRYTAALQGESCGPIFSNAGSNNTSAAIGLIQRALGRGHTGIDAFQHDRDAAVVLDAVLLK
jgi:ATP:corrinoid adenosyltransferase